MNLCPLRVRGILDSFIRAAACPLEVPSVRQAGMYAFISHTKGLNRLVVPL